LDGGLDNLDATMTAVQSIQQQFGLIDEDFEALCTEMKQVISLDHLQVGGSALYGSRGMVPHEEELVNDPTHPDRQAMDKFLYFTERAF
jgi:hypothetical protein